MDGHQADAELVGEVRGPHEATRDDQVPDPTPPPLTGLDTVGGFGGPGGLDTLDAVAGAGTVGSGVLGVGHHCASRGHLVCGTHV
ncbi:hypothetical protein GCM10010349_63260 [Streptomyces flavofungini]|nr:hypothetical protein GCM10010349_63260 [Streptomyces flavofungini]